MDGLSSGTCNQDQCSFEYVNPSDVTPYVALAQQYGWANLMFQTNLGPSPPSHQFIFGGNVGAQRGRRAGRRFRADNPKTGLGCLAPLNSAYDLISPQTAPAGFSLINDPLGTVCFTRDTIAILLEIHSPPLSWKYYAPAPPGRRGMNFVWNGELRDIFGGTVVVLSRFSFGVRVLPARDTDHRPKWICSRAASQCNGS